MYLSYNPSKHYCYIIQTLVHHNWHSICVQTYVSKQRSTLSDMSKSMHSCSRAMSCISRSSPCPICSHSSNVSGSTSAMMPHDPFHPTPGHSPNWGHIRRQQERNKRAVTGSLVVSSSLYLHQKQKKSFHKKLHGQQLGCKEAQGCACHTKSSATLLQALVSTFSCLFDASLALNGKTQTLE